MTIYGRKLANLANKGKPVSKRTERFEMRVSPEWLAKLDEVRGGTSRASYIHNLVEYAAQGPKTSVGPVGDVTISAGARWRNGGAA